MRFAHLKKPRHEMLWRKTWITSGLERLYRTSRWQRSPLPTHWRSKNYIAVTFPAGKITSPPPQLLGYLSLIIPHLHHHILPLRCRGHSWKEWCPEKGGMWFQGGSIGYAAGGQELEGSGDEDMAKRLGGKVKATRKERHEVLRFWREGKKTGLSRGLLVT